MEKRNFIIYIGDFDLRNENVQAHLVKNNTKILNRLGYSVALIGVNRKSTFGEIATMQKLDVGKDNQYLELENTLKFSGLFKYRRTERQIVDFMDGVAQQGNVQFVITYQAPTYAPILKDVAEWCRRQGAKYIVNCADITVFNSQPLLRRIVMTRNWNYLHKVNRKYADGLIAVSRYIEKFYKKDGMPTVIIPPLFDDFVDKEYKLAATTTFVYAGTPFVLKKNVNTVGMKDRLDKIVDLCLQLSSEGVTYQLFVVGITKELYTTCIPRHKDALDNNRDIVFKGRLTHKDALEAVRNADYMLNIRDRNVMNEAGLSTKVVESVSLGTPVVMNTIGDTFMYLREGITGYELSGDEKRDVAMLKTLCDKSLDERVTLKKHCAGDRTFALEKYEAKFEEFLAAVLTNK